MTPRHIIYISSIPWNYSWHRQQEMMSKFADLGYKILFVQPVNKKKPFNNSISQISNNIWILSVAGMPFERCIPIINYFNGRISRKQINKVLESLNFENPIIWFDRVHGVDYKYLFNKGKIIYDLIDEITAFGRYKNERMLISIENQILQKADILISSSQTLLRRKLTQSNRSKDRLNIFIPNGIDLERFIDSNNTWEGFGKLSHPIIGFVGDISKRRINFPLIKRIADKHPEWQFVFVGPYIDNDIQEYKSNNILFHPRVANNDIPAVIKSFDIGIIPYNVASLDMDYIFPRKVCEYLACGKPVISTPLNEISYFGSMCNVASDAETFEQGIVDSLKLKDSEKRKKYVQKFDWSYFIPSIISYL